MTGETKKVGLMTATSLVVGNMIASGVFMLPATLAVYGGISLVGWIISGVGAMSLALVYGWLSQVRPLATGGPYAYTRDGMGDFAGFLVAWGYWISVWCTNAAIAVAFVSYLGAFVPALASSSILAMTAGLAAIWFLTWVNTLGIREAGAVQIISTLLKLAPLAVIIGAGLFYLEPDHFVPFNRSNEPVWSAVTATTTLTLFAFLGLECATIPSESIRDPQKTIARATVFGTLLTTAIYLLGTIAVMGLVPPEELMDSQAPFADAAARIWGEPGRYLVAAGAVISTFGALNGWIVMQGQVPFAAARDNLFPALFKRKNKKDSPVAGILISSLLVSFLMAMNFTRSLADTFRNMVLLSTFVTLVPYCLSMVSYTIIAAKEHIPGQRIWLRMMASFIGFGFSIWAMIGCGETTVYWGFVLLMAGLPMYAIMRIKRF